MGIVKEEERKTIMALRVAFCDDEVNILQELSSLTDKYSVERNRDIETTAFQNPFDLIACVEKGTRFDLIFLDILMPGVDGIAAAQEIRSYDTNVKIIFLSSSPEYGVKSYTVKAYFYQVKPIWKDAFYELMDQIYDEIVRERGDCLVWKCKNGIVRFEMDQIEYCESLDRTLIFHMVNGKSFESAGKMDDLEEKMSKTGQFIRPHRSFLINMDLIENLSYKAIDMVSGAQIPVPHGKYEKLKSQYFDYILAKNRQ